LREGGKDTLERQRLAAQLHFLPARQHSECRTSCVGSGEQPGDGVQTLPRNSPARRRPDLVCNRTRTAGKHCEAAKAKGRVTTPIQQFNLPTLAEIRARSKDKVGSLRSTKHWFALRSLTHCALNNLRCAQTSKVIHLPASFPCARMPDAHARRVGCHRLRRIVSGNPILAEHSCVIPAPPSGTAPPSLVLLRHPGGAWATLARTLDDPSSSDVFGAIQPSRFFNGLRREGQA